MDNLSKELCRATGSKESWMEPIIMVTFTIISSMAPDSFKNRKFRSKKYIMRGRGAILIKIAMKKMKLPRLPYQGFGGMDN